MPIEIFLNNDLITTLGPHFDQMLIPSIGTTITWSGDDKEQTALICSENPKRSILYLRDHGTEGIVQVDFPLDTNLFGDKKEVYVVNYIKAKRI